MFVSSGGNYQVVTTRMGADYLWTISVFNQHQGQLSRLSLLGR